MHFGNQSIWSRWSRLSCAYLSAGLMSIRLGSPCTSGVQSYMLVNVTYSFTRGMPSDSWLIFLADSEPCTPDTPSATASPSTSEEPGPFTAPPSPSSSYDHGAPSFSPPLSTRISGFQPELPTVPPPTPAAASIATPHPPGPPLPVSASALHPSLYSPGNTSHLPDWLPYLTSATSATTRGKEKEQPSAGSGPTESVKRCGSPPLHIYGQGNDQAESMEELPPEAVCSPPAAHDVPPSAGQAPPSVGDILTELRTMNSHLSIIARALSQLASSLAPQQDCTDTPAP